MAVSRPDSGHKLIEGIFSMPGSQHDASISSQIERELVAFRQPRLFDNRLRDPYRQTVTPFR